MPGSWQQTCLDPWLGTQLVFLLFVSWGKTPHLLHCAHSPIKAAPSRSPGHLCSSPLTTEQCRVPCPPALPWVGFRSRRRPPGARSPARLRPPRSSREPRAPPVQQGGRRAVLLVTLPAAGGRCWAALPPVAAHRHHGAVARREGTPAAAAAGPSLRCCSSLSITDFTDPVPHLLWCCLPGFVSIPLYFLPSLCSTSLYPLRTRDLAQQRSR